MGKRLIKWVKSETPENIAARLRSQRRQIKHLKLRRNALIDSIQHVAAENVRLRGQVRKLEGFSKGPRLFNGIPLREQPPMVPPKPEVRP